MKIEKAEVSYQVTECDLKFGEQITLDGELLIPVSVLDKIRAEIDLETRIEVQHYTNKDAIIDAVLDVIEENMTEIEPQEREG